MATFDSLIRQYDRLTEDVARYRAQLRRAEEEREVVRRELKSLARQAEKPDSVTGDLTVQPVVPEEPSSALLDAAKVVDSRTTPTGAAIVAEALRISEAAASLRLRRAADIGLINRAGRGLFEPRKAVDPLG